MAMEKTTLVVVTMSAPTPPTDYMCSKIGLWGGNEGSLKDITETPKRLDSVTIMSNYSINSIEFSYTDQTGQKRSAGRWGGPGGTAHKIDLLSCEHVKEVSGTFNFFDAEICLRSFKLVTSRRIWGPWGEEEIGEPFSITAPIGTSVVGFFAREGGYLDAIGVYLNKL